MSFKREVKRELTDQERLEYADKGKSIKEEIEILTENFQAAKTVYRKNRTDLKKEIQICSDAVMNGVEILEVDCEERPNFDEHTMEVVRLDNSEVLESRSLTDAEIDKLKESD